MSESRKVFCKGCRYYYQEDLSHNCAATNAATSDWYGSGYISVNPKVQNKNNDCTHWRHRRSFIEWLNDFLK